MDANHMLDLLDMMNAEMSSDLGYRPHDLELARGVLGPELTPEKLATMFRMVAAGHLTQAVAAMRDVLKASQATFEVGEESALN